MTKPSAKQAVDILAELHKRIGSAHLAYWVTPNCVLTFAGARGVCDGVFYHPTEDTQVLNSWAQEIYADIQEIKSITKVLNAQSGVDVAAYGKTPIATYDLLLEKGLAYSLESTDLVNIKLEQLEIEDGNGEWLVADSIAKLLRSNEKFKESTDEYLQHVAAGIILGYPDKAITESIDLWDNKEPFSEQLISADIKGARFYDCPMPVYDYPRNMVNDSTIITHEKLWSGILKEFYESDFHVELAKDPHFQKKAKEIGIINTN